MDRRNAIRAGLVTTAGLAAGRVSPLAAASDAAEGRPGQAGAQPSELLIRGGRVVNSDGNRMADVRISGERIEEVGADLATRPDARVIDATGKLVMPGGIDPHTHLQGSFIDDLTTGTAAAAAGGITTVGTFAYGDGEENAVEAMDRWLAQVERSAVGDVFFHASSWPPEANRATRSS